MSRTAKNVLLGLGVGLVVLALVICLGHLAVKSLYGPVEGFDEESQPWSECAVQLPNESGRVVLLRRCLHPLFAEYDRQIRFEVGDDPNTVCWLPTNCGGRTCINVYWYPANRAEGPYVKLRDSWGVYVLDLQRKTASILREHNGVRYIGEIPPQSDGSVSSGWSKADGRKDWTYTVGKNEGRKLNGLLAEAKGLYLGRLDSRTGALRFVPADEAPEEEIDGW